MNETIETTVDKLTKQRESLDSIKNAITELPKSRGTSLAFTKLKKGRMYIGELALDLGKDFPYEKTKEATTAEGIQDAVDLSSNPLVIGDNEITNLNNLRDLITTEINTFLETTMPIKLAGKSIQERFVMNCNISEAYRGLKESRMYLGIRLGEIRDIAKIIQNGK